MKNNCGISISALSITKIINKHSDKTPKNLTENIENHKYIYFKSINENILKKILKTNLNSIL